MSHQDKLNNDQRKVEIVMSMADILTQDDIAVRYIINEGWAGLLQCTWGISWATLYDIQHIYTSSSITV